MSSVERYHRGKVSDVVSWYLPSRTSTQAAFAAMPSNAENQRVKYALSKGSGRS